MGVFDRLADNGAGAPNEETHESIARGIIEDCGGDAEGAVLALVEIIHLLIADRDAVMQAVSPGFVRKALAS